MDRPDSLKQMRNLFAAVAALAIPASAMFALSAHWWTTPFDYWLVWASFASGIAGVASTVTATVIHAERIDALRNN